MFIFVVSPFSSFKHIIFFHFFLTPGSWFLWLPVTKGQMHLVTSHPETPWVTVNAVYAQIVSWGELPLWEVATNVGSLVCPGTGGSLGALSCAPSCQCIWGNLSFQSLGPHWRLHSWTCTIPDPVNFCTPSSFDIDWCNIKNSNQGFPGGRFCSLTSHSLSPIFFLLSPLFFFLLVQLFFYSSKLYFGMVGKKNLLSIPWKAKFAFQLKVNQTICMSVEHSSSWPLSAKDPFLYRTEFCWNVAGIIQIPPTSSREHYHQIPDCSFT